MVTGNELSDRLEPMAVKELQQGMRRASFVVPFIAIQVLAIAAMAAEFAKGAPARDLIPGIGNVKMIIESGPFWITIACCVGIIMPLGGFLLMRQEVEEGNHELLLLTHLSRWKVVSGKFFTLWAVCILTLISVIPYVVVRYFIGGVEFYQEMMCALTVVAIAAAVTSGAIGVSSLKKLVSRIFVFILFLASLLASGAASLLSCYYVVERYKSTFWQQFWYNLNGFSLALCYTMLGLGLARSRLRLAVHAFEVEPSGLVVGLLIFAPFIIGLSALFTVGHASFLGSLTMCLVAIYADKTPRAAVKPTY